MSAAFTIRLAEAHDLPGINALMHASQAYQGEYYRILEGYYVTGDSLENSRVFLAENDEVLLGFYSLIVEKEPARYVLKPGILLAPERQAAFGSTIEQTVRFMNELVENGVVRWVPAKKPRHGARKR